MQSKIMQGGILYEIKRHRYAVFGKYQILNKTKNISILLASERYLYCWI